jgi:hypothetical protein
MRSFLDLHGDRLASVAMVSVMGGRGAPNAVAEVGRMLGKSPVLATAFAMREVDNGSCAIRLQAFGTAVRTSDDSQPAVRPATLSPQAV